MACFIVIGCNAQLTQNRVQDSSILPVIFSIDTTSIPLFNKTTLNFYYHDYAGYGHPISITNKEEQLFLDGPVILLESSDKQLPFLIYPGEKINIKYAGSDSVQMYICVNPERNNELNFFRELIKKTGNISYFFKEMPYLKRVNILDSVHLFETRINDIKNKRLDFLTTYAQQCKVSNGFIKLAINSILSASLYDSLFLFWNNRKLLMNKKIYKKLIAEKLTTIKNIDFMPFIFYLKACNALVSASTTGNLNYFIQDSSDFIERYHFIEHNFINATKDFLLFQTLYTAYNKAIPVSKEYIRKFNIDCKNQVYKKIITDKLDEDKIIVYPKGSNNLRFTDGKTVQDIQTIISKYKDKIVVLDFWASWCFPCREEMPYSLRLKKMYKNKKIAFVFISIDDNTDNWLKANAVEKLGDNNSFLLLNAYDASFVKKYGINSIPRYIIIGKDQKIISADAPRPSDPELKDLIDRNL